MLAEPQPYTHRFSGTLVTARVCTTAMRWPIWGSTNEKNPVTGHMEQPVERVERGDWEVTSGNPDVKYGDNKECRFIVPKWAFPLCYDVAPPPEASTT